MGLALRSGSGWQRKLLLVWSPVVGLKLLAGAHQVQDTPVFGALLHLDDPGQLQIELLEFVFLLPLLLELLLNDLVAGLCLVNLLP
jgi:hypothetical protein